MTSEIISTTPDSEIVSTRIVNASRELVFTAWTDPNHLKNWWGPAKQKLFLKCFLIHQTSAIS